MVTHYDLILEHYSRGFHLITSQIIDAIEKMPKNGLLHIFIKHTSAGITINENADPSVRDDFESSLNILIPENAPNYTHIFEGSDDMPAHLKTSIIGNSVSIPIRDYKLDMGIWQGVYFCEFRKHGGRRRIVITIYE